MPASPNLQLVAYGDDLLAHLADDIIRAHQAELPVLDSVLVLLPDLESAPRLRRLLLEKSMAHGHAALLGPRITGYQEWVQEQPLPGKQVISDHTRELMLVDALREHHGLFGEGNLWAVADSLLELFDELTLNTIGLPASLDDFTRHLHQAYRAGENHFAGLTNEARLVHTLWQAWHAQLDARHCIDRKSAYLLKLASTANASPQPLYLAGFYPENSAELSWLKTMFEHNSLTLYLQGQEGQCDELALTPDRPITALFQQLDMSLPSKHASELGRCLDSVYSASSETPIHARATAIAAAYPQSPFKAHLRIAPGDGFEHEAMIIDLQIRQWLLAGKRDIAIVTENRRLARRLRALLERSGIGLQDAAGWALSTTSAAAVIERWLECIEEDFPHRPLLDLLKSPFFIHSEAREAHLQTVYRLEQDIILHENIGRGLGRYRHALNSRRQRLFDLFGDTITRVDELLQGLEAAAAPLRRYRDGKRHSAHAMLATLLSSLKTLGMLTQLDSDAAGSRLLEEIGQMQAALYEEMQGMDWLELRTWFGRTLERFNFRPAVRQHQVSLMSLAQSSLNDFDALIIAGVEREYLPGAPATSPFFNEAVRLELGLPGQALKMAHRYWHFRRLLQAAPDVLLTLRAEEGGEPILPSPWLEAVRTFHDLAYADNLHDGELVEHARLADFQRVRRDSRLPPPSEQPTAHLPPEMLPDTLSASAYQQLVDCPYLFFSARGLRLTPPERIRESLEKSDYGEKVHRCLEAFHGGVNKLPGPWVGPLDMAHRDAAIALLTQIARQEFAADLEDNFLHRGWLKRWLDRIPDYIDWQIGQAQNWQVSGVELRTSTQLGRLNLNGRLDRIDESALGLAILDYKTGYTPRLDEVIAGESVQLPFYALLQGDGALPIRQVAYVSIDGKGVSSSALEGEELEQLAAQNSLRLSTLFTELESGAGLIAWGDEKTCAYCTMRGICRREIWQME